MYRDLAEAELNLANLKWSAAVLKGANEKKLISLQQDINKAEESLAEAKLLVAVAQNATATEVEMRKQTLDSIRIAHLNRQSDSGDDCFLHWLHVLVNLMCHQFAGCS